jgi:hypothetical protein
MDYATAQTLQQQLSALDEVSWSRLVMLDEPGGIDHISEESESFDDSSDLIEVMFGAYDRLIPASVVDVLSACPADVGIYDDPDCWVTASN